MIFHSFIHSFIYSSYFDHISGNEKCEEEIITDFVIPQWSTSLATSSTTLKEVLETHLTSVGYDEDRKPQFLRVKRNSVWQDIRTHLDTSTYEELMWPLQVSFISEEGVDGGGL